MQGVRPRLCIATLDPMNRGGILSLMKFVYEGAKKDGFEPYLAYNRVPGVRGEKRDGRAGAARESVDGMEGWAVERVLPQFEFLNYVANRKEWRRVLAAGDVFFAVCGNSLAALPLLFAKKRFSLWVASTLYEERVDRMRRQSIPRKIRDYLSLPILLRLERMAFMRAEKILALSAYTRDAIKKRYPSVAGKITVAPYPIDPDFFAPGPAQIPATPPYIFFAGRLEDDRKNIALALRAFAIVRAKKRDLRLKLSGGALGPRDAALARQLGIEEAVDVLPRVPAEDLRTLYQGASVFIIPSFQEGLCISGLEAMSCGIPVVSTRCGGPEEFVRDNENGRLVPNGDERSFAAAVFELLEMPPARRAEMSASARRAVLEGYAPGKVWPMFRGCLTIKE